MRARRTVELVAGYAFNTLDAEATTELQEAPVTLRMLEAASFLKGASWTGAKYAGKAGWVLATTGLIMALPLILEVDREQHAQEMNEQLQQQQQQQAMGLYPQQGGAQQPPGAAPGAPAPGAPAASGGAPAQGPPLPPGVTPGGSTPI